MALLLALGLFGLFDSVRSRAPRAEHQGPGSPPAATQPRRRASGNSSDLEDQIYQVLWRDHEFNHPHWPFLIKVRDVQDRTLIDATFKHRVRGKDEFDAAIQARRAVLRVDAAARVVRVHFEDAEVQQYRRDPNLVLIKDRVLEIPLP
jgi:hypothetical protein